MSAIVFEKISSSLSILNPFNNFASEEHSIEVRKDPLLGDTSVYNPFLKDKARAFFGENDQVLIKKLAEESAKNCIFCGPNVLDKTARYPSHILSEGRIQAGEAVLFANLFSVGAYHPVVALGNRHIIRLPEFTPALFTDGFKAAQRFLVKVYQSDPSAVFTAVCANYLFPAGASLVHPHLQMLVTPAPYSYFARMLDACRRYYEKNLSSYFEDLVSQEERIGERSIDRQRGWTWLAAFSPLGSNEITAIHSTEGDFGALPEADLRELSDGIVNVLLLYHELGHLSFNFTLFSVRQPGDAGFRCVFKMISRQNLYPNYRNDDYFLQKMLQSELIFNLPEELAGRLRSLFRRSAGTIDKFVSAADAHG